MHSGSQPRACPCPRARPCLRSHRLVHPAWTPGLRHPGCTFPPKFLPCVLNSCLCSTSKPYRNLKLTSKSKFQFFSPKSLTCALPQLGSWCLAALPETSHSLQTQPVTLNMSGPSACTATGASPSSDVQGQHHSDKSCQQRTPLTGASRASGLFRPPLRPVTSA